MLTLAQIEILLTTWLTAAIIVAAVLAAGETRDLRARRAADPHDGGGRVAGPPTVPILLGTLAGAPSTIELPSPRPYTGHGDAGVAGTVPIPPVPDTAPGESLGQLYAEYCRTVDAVVDAIPESDVEAALRRVLAEAADQMVPPVLIDGPPGGRGILPAPGIPVIRVGWGCSLCQDGQLPAWSATGACVWCGARAVTS